MIWSERSSPGKVAIVITAWCLAVVQSAQGVREFESHYRTNINSYAVAGIVTLFFAIMMLIALKRTGMPGRRPWMLAGGLTYPLYLLHSHIGFMVFNLGYPSVNAHLLFWGTIVAVLTLAYAVHFLIEKRFSAPLRTALNRLADRIQRTSGPAEEHP